MRELESLSDASNPVGVCFCVYSLIDLLAQFAEGSLSKSNSAKRFLKFLIQFGKFTKQDAETLYQHRNATVHGFGNHAYNAFTKREYRFYFDFEQPTIIDRKGNTTHGINPTRLRDALIHASTGYQNELNSNRELNEKFEVVYRRIGRLI